MIDRVDGHSANRLTCKGDCFSVNSKLNKDYINFQIKDVDIELYHMEKRSLNNYINYLLSFQNRFVQFCVFFYP